MFDVLTAIYNGWGGGGGWMGKKKMEKNFFFFNQPNENKQKG